MMGLSDFSNYNPCKGYTIKYLNQYSSGMEFETRLGNLKRHPNKEEIPR